MGIGPSKPVKNDNNHDLQTKTKKRKHGYHQGRKYRRKDDSNSEVLDHTAASVGLKAIDKTRHSSHKHNSSRHHHHHYHYKGGRYDHYYRGGHHHHHHSGF